MALYFNERGLHYEDGRLFLISYREILEECLKGPFKTVSISTIIFDTIRRMTGMKVIKRNYNQSPVYRWLEKRISQDSRYKIAKQYKVDRDNVYRMFKKEHEKKMRELRGLNRNLDYIEKRKQKLKECPSNSSKEW